MLQAVGKVKREFLIVNGAQEGTSKSFYESGTVLSEENYHGGKMEGETRIFNQQGEVSYIDLYVNGTKVKRKGFDARGKMDFEQNY